jgi:uroporphyrin-III C-methyltransferase/precorrin-2 dehydrogenase/sirohydrochlorin ferrochelatase/uroporphyrin-III C-methyltransferase
MRQEPGKVYLVGAGPGDPDLLTVRALRLLQGAEVIVYDRLVAEAVLDLVPAGVTRICVGKAHGRHSLSQAEINTLLVRLAAPGRSVVRLKGGDPYVFGRGSEEALFLRRHGIAFEVVPGVTAASACSAYAGIPLTHRGMSRGVRLVTGHLREDEPLDLDWPALADPSATLVIYMGLANLPRLCTEIIAAGLDPATPAAAIERGTTPEQRRILATLAELPRRVAAAGLAAPVLTIIGHTVGLAESLDWFQPEAREHAALDRSASG